MNYQVSFWLKLFYCLTLFSVILPMGLASANWVAMGTGGNLINVISLVGPVLFLGLGLYRIHLVIWMSGTLDSPHVAGVIAMLRTVGIFCIYAGAVIGILNLISRPLVRVLITNPSDNGVEYFVAGVYLALAGGIGALGLLLFEFSRLISFERHARERNMQ